ncbi:transient receptor potential cation channel protein painless-like [Onthophagus taurus]|uniref:transient receptor potential cation channel protein painless-like n=1 Tax=Onthophagus taurus TaxID=166361 RepID=UPI000C20884B|nr:transient receptor potential cation channel protein painless-like [Onthophagus taurus]
MSSSHQDAPLELSPLITNQEYSIEKSTNGPPPNLLLVNNNTTFERNVIQNNLISFLKNNNQEEFINYFQSNEEICRKFYLGKNGEYILQEICEKNLINIIKFLLLIQTSETRNNLFLRIISEHGIYNIFQELLLQEEHSYSDKFLKDILLILLHNQIVYESNEVHNFKACLKFLVNQNNLKIAVNGANIYGNTPLHYAVKYADLEIITNLLKRGAFLDVKNNLGVMPIDNTYPEDLEKLLDDCVKTGKPNCKVIDPYGWDDEIFTFNYARLFSDESSEAHVLLRISENRNLQYLVKHPVISTLLYLKCFKMQRFFIINCMFHLIFLVNLIGFIWYSSFFSYLLLPILIIFILKEFTQIFLVLKIYFTNPESYLDIFILVTTGYTICTNFFYENNKTDLNYYKQLMLAGSIFSSFIKMMLLIARCLHFSTYVSVLKTVTSNFLKFLLWSSCLLIAFTFGIYIIYQKPRGFEKNQNDLNSANKTTDFFDDPILTFLKIIVMLTGELDAKSLLDEGNLETMFNKIIFLFFVFFVTITLSNVINGLAISDIQTIKTKAEILNLVDRIKRIYYLEMVISKSAILSNIFKTLIPVIITSYFCHNCRLLDLDTFDLDFISRANEKRISLFTYDPLFIKWIIMIPNGDKGLIFQKCKLCGKYILHEPNIYMDKEIVKNTERIIRKRMNLEK